MRVSKFTRRNGCAPPPEVTGATTDRVSDTSGPDNQMSVAGVLGKVAVYVTPLRIIVTEALGKVGVKAPAAGAAEAIAYVPVAGTLAVTMAKRIEPSGHRLLMSVWVVRFPTCSPFVAAPWGTASPNVTQPEVRPIVATAGVCARRCEAAPHVNIKSATKCICVKRDVEVRGL